VAVLAVADQVDDDVGVELLAVLRRDAHHVHARFDVVAVDVEDGNVEQLRLRGAVQRRAALLGLGRVADLVVDDEVHRAAGVVGLEAAEVERLGDEALARERGVTVNDEGHDGVARVVSTAARSCLARTRPSTTGCTKPRCDGLNAIVRCTFLPASRRPVVRVPHVVLHVAAVEVLRRVGGAGDLAEDLFGRLAHDVRQHVQAAAVRHAEHDLFHAQVAAQLEELGNHRQLRLATFGREALLALELGVNRVLEGLGLGRASCRCAAARRP
jgi:hypothetical protein